MHMHISRVDAGRRNCSNLSFRINRDSFDRDLILAPNGRIRFSFCCWHVPLRVHVLLHVLLCTRNEPFLAAEETTKFLCSKSSNAIGLKLYKYIWTLEVWNEMFSCVILKYHTRGMCWETRVWILTYFELSLQYGKLFRVYYKTCRPDMYLKSWTQMFISFLRYGADFVCVLIMKY